MSLNSHGLRRAANPRARSACFWSIRLRHAVSLTFVCLMVFVNSLAAAPPASTLDQSLMADLREATEKAGVSCGEHGADRLVLILCRRVLRVGVRNNYPGFGDLKNGRNVGYEIGIANAIGDKLGVRVEFVPVTPVNRIAYLGDGRIDLIIATMGHTTPRDEQVRFIRPHYYRSQTVIVGADDDTARDPDALVGRGVCVTVGNASNLDISRRGANLMLFDSPDQLIRQLSDGVCALAAQDDSFFLTALSGPALSGRYEIKFGLSTVPWGMAVARDDTVLFAHTLSSLSAIFHRDGIFLRLARESGVAIGFLDEQQMVWRGLCGQPNGPEAEACLSPPLEIITTRTTFAPFVERTEAWIANLSGSRLSLEMFKSAPAWAMVCDGAITSGILITLTVTAMLMITVSVGGLLVFAHSGVAWSVRALCALAQSCPIVLALVVISTAARGLFGSSTTTGIVAASVTLGIINGTYAARAIAEAAGSLAAEQTNNSLSESSRHLFLSSLSRASTQIVSFIVNAIKGTPVASFIGIPELMNAMTDSTSYSADRASAYWLILLFYTAVVLCATGAARTVSKSFIRPKVL